MQNTAGAPRTHHVQPGLAEGCQEDGQHAASPGGRGLRRQRGRGQGAHVGHAAHGAALRHAALGVAGGGGPAARLHPLARAHHALLRLRRDREVHAQQVLRRQVGWHQPLPPAQVGRLRRQSQRHRPQAQQRGQLRRWGAGGRRARSPCLPSVRHNQQGAASDCGASAHVGRAVHLMGMQCKCRSARGGRCRRRLPLTSASAASRAWCASPSVRAIFQATAAQEVAPTTATVTSLRNWGRVGTPCAMARLQTRGDSGLCATGWWT